MMEAATANQPTTVDEAERQRRWRLILGGGAADGTNCRLSGADTAIDRALAALYGAHGSGRGLRSDDEERTGGLGASAPTVARWLGDIREYFPTSVVRIMQQDAMDRLNLRQMLLEPEMLNAVEPDVRLVADLVALKSVLPAKSRETARLVVRRVVEELERRLASPLRQAVTGSLNRASRNRRPKHHEIDWHRTIRANLKHYQATYRTIVPEIRHGFGRRQSGLRDIVVCVDQSGSMATSVVYASVMAATLASIRAISTRLVVFDTAVVDLTDQLDDPVDVIFGVQLGGGTDINQALTYCQSVIQRPTETIFVLISDLYEGGDNEALRKRVGAMIGAGVQFITLLALNDEGAPAFDHANAAAFTKLGSPCFACTPDLFPELMAAAIQRQDIAAWAASRDLKVRQ